MRGLESVRLRERMFVRHHLGLRMPFNQPQTINPGDGAYIKLHSPLGRNTDPMDNIIQQESLKFEKRRELSGQTVL